MRRLPHRHTRFGHIHPIYNDMNDKLTDMKISQIQAYDQAMNQKVKRREGRPHQTLFLWILRKTW